MSKRVAIASSVVISITFILFFSALFTKGFTHDLLLETGVFLVSVKLIIMSVKINEATTDLRIELNAIKTLLDRRS